MMRMTEMMHQRAGFFGGPMMPPFMRTKKEEVIKREDESNEDIMARMNKLHEEIGERASTKKYERVDTKSERLLNVLLAGGVFMLIALASFVMTCKNKAKRSEEEYEDDKEPRRARSHNE